MHSTIWDKLGMAGLLIGFAAIFGLGLAPFTRRFHATIEGDLSIVRYSPFFQFVGWGFLAFGFFIFYILAISNPTRSGLAIGLSVSLFISLSCWSFFLEFNYVQFSYDQNYVYVRSPWRKFRKIKWDDIVSHSFSRFNNWHILRTNDGDLIRLSNNLSGMESVTEELVKRRIFVLKNSAVTGAKTIRRR